MYVKINYLSSSREQEHHYFNCRHSLNKKKVNRRQRKLMQNTTSNQIIYQHFVSEVMRYADMIRTLNLDLAPECKFGDNVDNSPNNW